MEYLLSVENLKKLGIIHNNTDTKILAVAITRSQDMHIQPTGVPAPVAFPSSFHLRARLAAAFIPEVGLYVSAITY